MTICLVDTDVFCNLVPVPGRDQHHEDVFARHKELLGQRTRLLLPMAAIMETGNHIAYCRDGHQRRRAAARFAEAVCAAILGEAPWTPTPFVESDDLRQWLARFPDSAMQGKGLGDFSIIMEYERQCALHKGRRVFIWSYDQHLSNYDRPGRLV